MSRSLHAALPVLAAFALGAALMLFLVEVQGAGGEIGLPDNDSYYHVKMAELLPSLGYVETLPWLRFVWWRQEGDAFVSHHAGFHALLAPFVSLSKALGGDSMRGGRWAASVIFGLNLVLLAALIRECGWRRPWLWLLPFVLLPPDFFERQSAVRAIGISWLFLQAIALLLMRHRPIAAGLAIAAYTVVYLGSVMFSPILVAIWVFACWVRREEGPRPGLFFVAATAGGWGLGLLIHPYRDGAFEFLEMQVFGSGLSPDITVGREWRPYRSLSWFLQLMWPLLAVMGAAFLSRWRLRERLDRRAIASFLWMGLFFALMLKARRFVEYWAPFGLLAAAAWSAPWEERGLAWLRARWPRGSVPGGPAVALGLFGLITVLASLRSLPVAREANRTLYDGPALRSLMGWLVEHSRPGEVVFTDDWDLFPVYFYWNAENHYVVGLDPAFTHTRRPDVWARYRRLTRGDAPYDGTYTVAERGALVEKSISVRLSDIRDFFGADWVITDRDHARFARDLQRAPGLFTRVRPGPEVADPPYVLWRVRRAR